jgi:ferric-dicitrate binding protein FerR (iron transport regulator)
MPAIRLAALAFLCVALAVTASAQVGPAHATLVLVDGIVFADGQLVTGADPVTIEASTTIRTADGRAVVALKAGGVLTLDAETEVRVLPSTGWNFSRVEVLDGTAIVTSATSAPLVFCQSETRLSSGGAFRFDVDPARDDGTRRCQFRVYDGAAAVTLATMVSALRSGQTMTLDPTCGDMIQTRPFAVEGTDEFDRWSREQAASVSR